MIFTVSGAYKDKWEVTAFYLCDQDYTLDLMYNMDMREDDGTETGNHPKCEPPDKRSPNCFKYGQNVTVPNMFGAETKRDALEMTYVYIGTKILESKCHQHVEEFACRSLYPECEQLDVLYPCRSMCYEVLSACGSIFDGFPLLDCRAYPVSGNGTFCFSKPVECLPPENPNHGRVHYNSIYLRGRATYTCDRKYRVVGESTRICMANGTWSGSTPYCEPIVAPSHMPSTSVVLICTLTILFSLTTILLTVLILNPQFQLIFCPLKILGDSFYWKKIEDPSKENDAFVLFHECDHEWVVNEIVPKLDTHYRIIYRERDWELGKLVNEFIEFAVSSSNVGIIVVSQKLIECNVELYNVTLAKYEHIRRNNFKVISIIEPNTGDLTPRMKSLMSYTLCLRYENSRKFWQRLYAEMPGKNRIKQSNPTTFNDIGGRSMSETHETQAQQNNHLLHQIVSEPDKNNNNNNITHMGVMSPLNGFRDYPSKIYYI